MRRAAIVIFGLLISSAFVSCRKAAKEPTSYFDSLVTTQVKSLSAAKAQVSKMARIDTKEDQSSFIPDTTVWENEIGVFRQLNAFEKPAYRDAYEIRDGVRDVKSNLLIKSYKANRKVPVPELKFFYYKNIQNLKRIEAVYQEVNTLYSTQRFMSMDFEEIAGKPMLNSYLIRGYQKMILSDSVKIMVKSIVSF